MFDYTYEKKLSSIPDGFKKLDEELKDYFAFESIMPLFWADHCLECGAPECYKICKLYEADRYGRCMRTEYGARTSYDYNGDFPITEIQFRKWSKLRCGFNTQISYDKEAYKKQYIKKYLMIKRNLMRFTNRISVLPPKFRDLTTRFVHHEYIKKFIAKKGTPISAEAELLFAFYSYEERSFTIFLDAYSFDSKKMLLRNSYSVNPGSNIWHIPFSFFSRYYSQIEALELYPENNVPAKLAFYFSDFVTRDSDRQQVMTVGHAPKAKCVVWDLDNTLWDGTISEDGINGIVLRETMVAIIEELDKRGVLQSIASKNNPALPMAFLKSKGLDQFFLYPQINWGAKSESIKAIRDALNIGIDTFVFIDDSEIERHEVEHNIPSVRVYSDKAAQKLLSFPEFDLLVTEDSKNRRKYYLAEYKRKEDSISRDDNYESFIKSCNIIAEVNRCISCDTDIDRCNELIQRTNQLNSATRRLPRNELEEYANAGRVYTIRCKDDYGEYGVVGCIIMDSSGADVAISDFILSCRVAQKKVESAIIAGIGQAYKKDIIIRYVPTEKNKILREELISIGGIEDKDNFRFIFKYKSMKCTDWVKFVFVG